MSSLSIEVEIVDGKVTPVPPHRLPASGRGVLTVRDVIEAPGRPAEIVEGPDGLLLLRGEGLITSEMVQKAQEQLDLEDALRYLGPSRAGFGRTMSFTIALSDASRDFRKSSVVR